MSTFVRPTWTGFGRAVLLGAIVALFGAPGAASAQDLADKYERNRQRQSEVPNARFSLHASASVVLEANQFQCGLLNDGSTCTDIFNSPTGGGGFWPTGSPNQYMFNSGIMIAGIIPSNAGFAWAGDTTGAYFMDARGTQQHGTPITNIYNSLNPADLAAWPAAGSVPGFPFATAYIVDEDIFSPVLTEGGPGGGPRASGSQQDSWVMYWDGDPALSANRDHPMGVTIEQRTMAWNFPSGNEATIYIFYKITNVTDNTVFQQLNETRYGVELPDDGWSFDSIYIAYDADADVTTDAAENFASVILPFNMGITYHATFTAPEFQYPPSLFFPPFFTSSPGIIGVQYLKSPEDPETGEEVGLTLFSVHENPGSCTGLCDPEGVKQLWRYISGNIRPGLGDPECTFSDPIATRICYLPQEAADARFYQASGPFSLDAGESVTIVVGMMAAATVNAAGSVVPGGVNPPGVPSLQPGCDDPVLPIEVAAGWANTPAAVCAAAVPGEPLDLRAITVVPSSLLGRAQVAQAVFDEKFLLPFAPEPPEFFVIPGDEQIAIIWEESATEDTTGFSLDPVSGDTIWEGGDPFFNAAGDTSSALFNANYRQFDVEGYRIYKSTDNSNFDLIAQYDYATSTFIDVRCESSRQFVPGDVCADTTALEINDLEDIDADLLVDPFVLFGAAEAQRVRLDNNQVLAIRGDTASAGGPDLTDTGVPFAFVDNDVRNGFRYYYQVRAFDINSTFSGPISLESSSPTKSAIPQSGAPNQVVANFSAVLQSVATGTVLDQNGLLPRIDPEDGTFAGPMPPTNGLQAVFAPLVGRLLPPFSMTARIDSVLPGPTEEVACVNGNAWVGHCFALYTTVEFNGVETTPVTYGFTPTWAPGGGFDQTEYLLGAASIPADSASLAEFGIEAGFVGFNLTLQGIFDESIFHSSFEGQAVRRGLADASGGSRWFSGPNESVPDPTAFIAVGSVNEADTVWAPVHHTPINATGATYPASTAMQYWGYMLSGLMRVADLEVTWTGGTIEVMDVTHDVSVQFHPDIRQSWGFVTDGNGNGMIDWNDFNYIDDASQVLAAAGVFTDVPADRTLLTSTPTVTATSTQGIDDPATMAATGQGFGLYINASRFIFELPGGALPADGTVWTLRTYHGIVDAEVGGSTADPSGYAFVANDPDEGLVQIRPPLVPGIEMVMESTARTELVGDPDLRLVHTVPDPYYAQSRFDLSPVEKALRFVNLPSQATIRIYTVSGLLVDVINHNDPAGGGLETWDLKNRSGQFVASGVYFFHVTTEDGQEHIGRFTVINSGIGQ